MRLFVLRSTIGCALLLCAAKSAFGQSPGTTENNAVRVTVSMKADGSRTVYKFDDAQHKAVAITTDQDGKLREKIHYDMDEAGRFSSGAVFGSDGRLRFKSQYKYDDSGRLQQETQNADNGTLLHKIVYSYDPAGKQTGYSIFDANGKLVGSIITGSPTPKRKK
jgi:YD repeat-containing protein